MSALGDSVRRHRTLARLTQRQLAEAIGTSAAFVSLVEQGKSDPSINVLRNMARVLQVPVAALFDGSGDAISSPSYINTKPPTATLVRKNMRKRFVNPSRPAIVWELLSPDLQRAIEFVSVRYEPGAAPGELIGHQGEECGVVIKGRLEVCIEDEVHILEEGDSIYFASSRPHAFRNAASQETITIWAITPPSF